MRKVFYTALLLCAMVSILPAQKKDNKVIQFSGYALTSDSLMGVPFTHITILNRGRIAQSGPDGFFSFAAVVGDTLYFTCVGFQPVRYVIPTSLEGDKFSVIQLMTKSDNYLPVTVIYPWGDKSNFGEYFKNLKLPKDQLEIAQQNLDRERLRELGKRLEPDALEGSQMALANRNATNYYYGQPAPQNIFNPLAWAEFIKAWQNGQFKRDQQNSTGTPNNTGPGQDLYTPVTQPAPH